MGVDCCLPLTDFIFCFSKEARKHHGNQMHRLILLSSLRSLQFFSFFFSAFAANYPGCWQPGKELVPLSYVSESQQLMSSSHHPNNPSAALHLLYRCAHWAFAQFTHQQTVHVMPHVLWEPGTHRQATLGNRNKNREYWGHFCLLSSLKIGKSVSVEGV